MTMTKGQRWVLALTSTASLMILLDALVVTTALHAIAVDLHASIADLEWTVNAYTLPFAVLLMAGAGLGERYGRRRVLLGGLALFGIASAGCALAPSLGWLIATRAIQGAGAAAVAPAALSVLSAAFGPEQRPRVLGLFASITGLGTLGGPLVGGAIVQNLDVAVDILDQRTDRRGADPVGCDAARAERRFSARSGLRRDRIGQRRSVRAGVGFDPGKRVRLG